MSTQIGRFEILSEIAKSVRGGVFKANDPTSNQTVALKTVCLDIPEDQAKEFVERVLAEGEHTRELNSQNLALLYGAGQIEDQFCAAMEYVQGNSIATMLARHEGFSIWDLLDISRQVCAGLDHASSIGVVHHSLEPAKIMVQWDGLVKILGYGISTMSLLDTEPEGVPSPVLHYMSPEQVGGGATDGRSNLFTWGAILYEMVTDQPAFDGTTTDVVFHNILNENPVPPSQINNKIHPAVSELIMKALAKNPDERYQSGREMLDDLEKCKESTGKSATKKSEPARTANAPAGARGAAASKFAGAVAPKPAAAPRAVAAPKPAPPAPVEPVSKVFHVAPPAAETESNAAETADFEPSIAAEQISSAPAHDAHATSSDDFHADASGEQVVEPPKKAAAAAAGWNSGLVHAVTKATGQAPKQDASQQFISSVVKASVQALEREEAVMSAAVQEPEVKAPRIAVDPMMAAMEGTQAPTKSFSDLDELPPLKEVYVEPPPPPSVTEPVVVDEAAKVVFRRAEPEKPKVQPREVAEKAIKEIKTVPPKLMLYSVSGAVVLILVIALGVLWRSQTADDDTGPVRKVATKSQATAETPEAAPAEQQALDTPVDPEPEVRPNVIPTPGKHASNNKKRASAPAPATVAVVPGQLSLDSTPEGAQVQVDGRGDASWVTPFNLSGLTPGQHTVSVLKSGYTSETRTVEVTSGSKSFLVIHLAQVAATVSVTSQPAGASIFVDGKDSGHVTPAQINVDKGSHTVLVRKQGFLDETATAEVVPGQTVHVSQTLRALGNVDEIKTVGKFKKLFGGGDSNAGMGSVSIKTQPKGAQVAVNRRILDKPSPVEFVLGPGNYLIDITMTGYKPIHKVITVEKGGKLALDEVMEHE